MNIVNIGIDKSLVGGRQLGDAVARHKKYGEYTDHLDIIVYTDQEDKLEKYYISDKVLGHPTNSRSKLNFFFDTQEIFKKINEQHPVDIIVCQDPFICGLIGIWLKKKFPVKVQINFHGDFWQNTNWLKERWLNFIFLLVSKYTVFKADAIRVMSEGQKEKLIKAGIKANKIRVISTPVNIDNFLAKQPLPAELKTEKKVILMVGRKDKVKDFSTLFKAICLVYEKFVNLEFWLVGNYTEEEKSKLPLPPKLTVKLFGRTDINDLPKYYQAADLTVLSSTSESFGKVLVEANAAGKPVIATTTTGAKEIIQDGHNGYLVPIKDYQALADKVLYLLNNPDQAKKMGENGLTLVKERFSDNTDKIINFWQDIINNKL